jgi:hypothetical protein
MSRSNSARIRENAVDAAPCIHDKDNCHCSMWAFLMMAVHGAPTGRPGAYGEKIIQQRRRHRPVSSSDQRCKQETSPCLRKSTPTIMLLSLSPSPKSMRTCSLLPWFTLAQKSQSSHNSRRPLTQHAPLALPHQKLARDRATSPDRRSG